jgi:nicotinate-nucleotide--dimethylbenzimidazole phosphoribosyltransferase
MNDFRAEPAAVSELHAAEARARLDALAKPKRSLGELERLAERLCGSQAKCPPTAERPRVIVFVADHGVAHEEPVTAYPPSVTRAMLTTYARGRAAVNVLARAAGASFELVDVGVRGAGALGVTAPDVVVHRPRVREDGSRNIAREPAMSADELAGCLNAGVEAATRAAVHGVDVLALGEMGIGNTTAASAVVAKLLDLPASAVVGPGAGLDAEGVARKVLVVERALERTGVNRSEPLEVLRELGGLELAAIAGAALAAAERRIPVVVDGFIASAAILAAARYRPHLVDHLLFASRSPEPGHHAVLEALGCRRPILDLGLRLGEGSAAALALPVIVSACRVMSEMATLEQVLEWG